MADINFGTREEGVTVKASRLEPGVLVSGMRFDRMNTLVVQDVRQEGMRMVWVDVVEQETGDHISRALYGFSPVVCWGRI